MGSTRGRIPSAIVAPSSPAAAPICALLSSTLSLISLSELSVSPDMINPSSSALSPYCLKASPPSSTIPANWSADLPNTAYAFWSRSVSFSMFESAFSVSLNTSSASRIDPSALVTDTPKSLNASGEPDMPFFILANAPVISSTDTSTRSDAYFIFCKLSVLMPVCLDSVLRSSAAVMEL